MNIVAHVMSTARTFELGDWPISLVFFDKTKGKKINKDKVEIDRYELNRIPKQNNEIGTDALKGKKKDNRLHFIKTYTYQPTKPNLINEIEKKIKESNNGGKLGSWCYEHGCLNVGNGGKESKNILTTNNLYYALISASLNFNVDEKWFEYYGYTYKGTFENLNEELKNDAIMMSMFYVCFLFSNKEKNSKKLVNYLIPFTAEELGCGFNTLNNLEWLEIKHDSESVKHIFNFREWFHKFKFSQEALDLYNSALEIVRYYHSTYKNTDFNDSFFDVCRKIMKREYNIQDDYNIKEDTRTLNKQRHSKGEGFKESALCKENNQYITNEAIPIFQAFFKARTELAKKINKQLLDAGLLLWERENLF